MLTKVSNIVRIDTSLENQMLLISSIHKEEIRLCDSNNRWVVQTQSKRSLASTDRYLDKRNWRWLSWIQWKITFGTMNTV